MNKIFTLLVLGWILTFTEVSAQAPCKYWEDSHQGNFLGMDSTSWFYGRRVSLSGDGQTWIAQGIDHPNNGGYWPLHPDDELYTRIYRNMGNGTFIESGVNQIDPFDATDHYDIGDVAINNFGNSYVISTTDVTAVGTEGRVRVYEGSGIFWTQKGSAIYGYVGEEFGGWVDMNRLGNTIAASLDGGVRVFKFISGSWQQRGADVFLSAYADQVRSISLSGSGMELAVIYEEQTPADSIKRFYLAIYRFQSGSWNLIGNRIPSHYPDDFKRQIQCDLSRYGGRVVFTEDARLYGATRVFEWNGSIWNQLGNSIVSTVQWQTLGGSAQISDLGNHIVVTGGHASSYLTYQEYEAVNIYEYTQSDWSLLYEFSPPNEELYSRAAQRVAVSFSAGKVILGQPWHGHYPYFDAYNDRVCMFDLIDTCSQSNKFEGFEEVSSSKAMMYPNPTKDLLYLGKDYEKIQSIKFYDLSGSLIREIRPQSDQLDIGGFTVGTYIVMVETETETQRLKITKQY